MPDFPAPVGPTREEVARAHDALRAMLGRKGPTASITCRRGRQEIIDELWPIFSRRPESGEDHSPDVGNMIATPDAGWLIEHEDEPKWLETLVEIGGWTKDSLRAIRFARRCDAEAFAQYYLGEGPYRITEHGWPPIGRSSTPDAGEDGR